MSDGNPWVCGNCHSINPERSGRCYSCRTPRAMALDPNALSTSRIVPKDASPKLKARIAAEAGATYHATLPWAILFGVAVCVVLGLTILRLLDLAILVDPGLADSASDLDARLTSANLINVAWIVSWIVGSVTWGIWLSRVVANLPALGGGWPGATPRSAFLESLVPVFNLYWTAAIVRGAIVRLSAPRSPALGTWTAWLICVVVAAAIDVRIGPFFILREIVGTVIFIVVGVLAGTRGMLVSVLVIEGLATALIVIGGVLVLRIVASVETMQASRVAELAAETARR